MPDVERLAQDFGGHLVWSYNQTLAAFPRFCATLMSARPRLPSVGLGEWIEPDPTSQTEMARDGSIEGDCGAGWFSTSAHNARFELGWTLKPSVSFNYIRLRPELSKLV